MDRRRSRQMAVGDPDSYNQQIIAEFRAGHCVAGGPLADASMLLLHHVGVRSCLERISPPVSWPAGDTAVAVLASNYGALRHPPWYHNLLANPTTIARSERKPGGFTPASLLPTSGGYSWIASRPPLRQLLQQSQYPARDPRRGARSPCPTTLVEGRLLLTRDLDRREPMPAVSAPRDGQRRRLGADGFLLWKGEQDDSLRCTARANDHAARNYPPGSSCLRPLALASPKRRRVARVSSS
jgi:deazaflavin-dependent oxidoreductase (nitroreductase family)